MKRVHLLGMVFMGVAACVTSAQTKRPFERMTYEEAKSRLPDRQLPDFWIGSVDGLSERLVKLTRGEVRTIAKTPGGRPVYLVAFGQRERVDHLANFNSAVGAREQSAYMDKRARKKPVLFFIGPVHGHEVEGLTGLVNLISILDTGQDLRGKEQPELRALADQCRILIIPSGNPDGTARFEPRALYGMEAKDVQFWGQGTWSDGTLCGWPGVKRVHPMVGDKAGFVGCYFNDKGINPAHDEFFAPMGPEAPAILNVAMDEGPDLAVALHSHSTRPALLRPAYVTTEVQEDVRSLAEAYYALLAERGLPHKNLFKVQPEGGEHPAAFSLTSAVYHVSGAVSFTFECPHGLVEEEACHVDLEQILTIQLTLYEAMMRHEIEKKAR